MLAATAVLCLGAGYLAATALRMDTDTAELLSPDLPFRKTYQRYREQFPANDPQLVLVVEALTPEQADTAAEVLMAALRARPERFDHVHRPDGGEFFRRNGLLFKSITELQSLTDRVARMQPLMALLQNDPSLRGLLGPIGKIVSGEAAVPHQANALLSRMTQIITAQMKDEADVLSWQRLMDGKAGSEPIARRIVLCQPHQDFGKLLSAREAIAGIEQIRAELGWSAPGGPRLKVTGQAALAFDEGRTLMQSMAYGGPASLLGVAILLLIGFRSFRMVGITILTLLIGLVLTAGFATLTIGRLNLISVAFAMLYVGLGVDFAIHFGLRYNALRRRGESRPDALRDTRREMAISLGLCALTTAIGFFAFVPTAFIGVAELGVISGGGMIISLIVTLTVFPAIITLLPQREWISTPPSSPPKVLKWIMERPARHRQSVIATAIALTVLSSLMIPRLRFNSDPLDLRQAESEAVQTMRELREHGSGEGQAGALILAESMEQAQAMTARLRADPQIKAAFSLVDLVPADQPQKLAQIEELALLAGTNWSIDPRRLVEESPADQIEAMSNFRDRLVKSNDKADEPTQRIYAELAEAITLWLQWVKAAPADQQATHVAQLQDRMLSTLPAALAQFQLALGAQAYSLETIPDSLRSLWIGADGTYRIVIQPRQALVNNEARKQFVSAVRAIEPHASGATVIQVEAGESIIESFTQAMEYALIGIVVLLLVVLRSVKHTLMVLLPLACGGLITAGVMVLLKIDFNFANVIALPLLLGAGVDNGIHMIQRSKQGLAGRVGLLETTTARGVLFSALTTLCGFGSLAMTSHPGMASMGLVLLFGLTLIVGCTLILLPALLHTEESTPDEDAS